MVIQTHSFMVIYLHLPVKTWFGVTVMCCLTAGKQFIHSDLDWSAIHSILQKSFYDLPRK